MKTKPIQFSQLLTILLLFILFLPIRGQTSFSGLQNIYSQNITKVPKVHLTDLDQDGDMDLIRVNPLGDLFWHENLDCLENFSNTKVIL
ncbi:hypothetical protein [Tenacibaculum sp.]|uniref:hypothetical protein n=1 Tax=Tenacibaculum sp. TaxID=1906242 RepID=UPI003AA8C41B